MTTPWSSGPTDEFGVPRREPEAEAVTVELPGPGRRPWDQPAPRKRIRGVREITGALAAGMVLLAAAVLGAQVYAWIRGTPGPGGVMVTAHLAAAGLAQGCQRQIDRRIGAPAGWAALVLLLVIAVPLWFFWW